MPPIAQYLFNGLVTGGILALPAVAFSVLWKLLRFPNFAVSTYLTIGAFAAFAVNHGAGWRIGWAWLVRPRRDGGRRVGGGPRGVSPHARPPALRAGHRVDRRVLRPRERRPLHLGQRLPELRRAGHARARLARPAGRARAARDPGGDRGAPRPRAGLPRPHAARHRHARHRRQPAPGPRQGPAHRAHRRPRDARRRRARRRRRRLPRARHDHRPAAGHRPHHRGVRGGDPRRDRLGAGRAPRRPRRGDRGGDEHASRSRRPTSRPSASPSCWLVLLVRPHGLLGSRA